MIERWARPAVLVPALLAVFAVQAGIAAVRDAPTYDEGVHLASGHAILAGGEFRGDLPLGTVWAALPLWLSGVPPAGPGPDQYARGCDFIHAGGHPLRRLLPARAMMIALGAAIGLVVYLWARELWGVGGAIVSLALFAFSPSMLAHSHLVTLDAPAALGYAATLWLFWRWTQRPTWGRAAAAGAALGGALLAKLTMLLLPPLLIALWLLWALRPGDGRAERLRRGALALALVGAIAAAILYAGLRFDTERFTAPLRFFATGEPRHAYLNGTLYVGGRWHYFLEAGLLKSTPATLILAGAVLVLGLRQSRGRSFNGWFIAGPLAAYLAAAMAFGMNIGHRHILPLYPLIFLLCGAAPRLCEGRPRLHLALGALLAAHAASSLWAAPRHLAYFNALAVGGGHRYLLNSNLDWGQDLSRLRPAMERHGIAEVHLYYSGTGDPRAYGIPHRKALFWPDFRPGEPSHAPASGDHVAVSANILFTQHVSPFVQLRARPPIAVAGDSIYLYRLP